MRSYLPLLIGFVRAANRQGFRQCSTSPFCSRYRQFVKRQLQHETPYPGWHVSTASRESGHVDFLLTNQGDEGSIPNTDINLKLTPLNTGSFRVVIDQVNQIEKHDINDFDRFHLKNEDFLPGFETQLITDFNFTKTEKLTTLQWSVKIPIPDSIPPFLESRTRFADSLPPISGSVPPTINKVTLEIEHFPLKIITFHNAKLMSIINGQNLMNFEVTRKKTENENENTRDATGVDSSNLFSFPFGSETDQIQQGPMAVGIDISFCQGRP